METFFIGLQGCETKVISDNVQISGIYRKLHTEMDNKSYNPFSFSLYAFDHLKKSRHHELLTKSLVVNLFS